MYLFASCIWHACVHLSKWQKDPICAEVVTPVWWWRWEKIDNYFANLILFEINSVKQLFLFYVVPREFDLLCFVSDQNMWSWVVPLFMASVKSVGFRRVTSTISVSMFIWFVADVFRRSYRRCKILRTSLWAWNLLRNQWQQQRELGCRWHRRQQQRKHLDGQRCRWQPLGDTNPQRRRHTGHDVDDDVELTLVKRVDKGQYDEARSPEGDRRRSNCFCRSGKAIPASKCIREMLFSNSSVLSFVQFNL